MSKEIEITRPDLIQDSEDGKSDKQILPVDHANSIAQGYIQELRRSRGYMEDNRTVRGKLTELVMELVSQERQNGSPTDFHNLACTLGGVQDDLACEVLDCGLTDDRYPMDVNLLADYLIYGIDCDRFEKCSEHFEELQGIEKEEWTWRCFAFSIAYLTRLKRRTRSKEERIKINEGINQLSKDYKKYLPNYEGGYREMAKLLSNNPTKELKLLTDALSNEKIDSCPVIAFRCADIYFAQQKYVEALDAIKRSLKDSKTQTQGGINKHYLYFLAGLSKIGILAVEETKPSEEQVLEIYSDFNKALSKLNDSGYKDTIEDETKFLIDDTGISVPDKLKNLVDLIGIY